MIYYILAILALVSFLVLVVIFRRQLVLNRGKNLDYHNFDNYAVTNLVIDYLAFKIVRFCQDTLKKFYLFSIYFIKNSMSTARYAVVKAEKHFNKIVDATPEPEDIHKTNNVSFFLKEIKDHKEAAMAELGAGGRNRTPDK